MIVSASHGDVSAAAISEGEALREEGPPRRSLIEQRRVCG